MAIDWSTVDSIRVAISTDGRRWEGTLGDSILATGGCFRWEVREEIAELLFTGRRSGEFSIEDRRYTWSVAD